MRMSAAMPAGVVDDAHRRGQQGERADGPEQRPHPRADQLAEPVALHLEEVDVVGQVRLAVHRRVRQHRGEGDRDDGDHDEGGQLLDVGEPPPGVSSATGCAPSARTRSPCPVPPPRAPRDRADEPRDVLAHAVALVADPVALAQVLPAARAREGDRAQQHGELQVAAGELPELRDRVRQLADRVARDRRERGDDEEDPDDGDLEEDHALQRVVDHRREGQAEADEQQDRDRDRHGVAAAEEERHQRRRARRPARPQVREVDEDPEEQPPVPPVAAEPGERGLAGRQRVALDLHVEEPLHDHADERAPEEHEPHLRGDVGPEDELTGGEPDAGADDAGADDPPDEAGGSGISRISTSGRCLLGSVGVKRSASRTVGPVLMQPLLDLLSQATCPAGRGAKRARHPSRRSSPLSGDAGR